MVMVVGLGQYVGESVAVMSVVVVFDQGPEEKDEGADEAEAEGADEGAEDEDDSTASATILTASQSPTLLELKMR